jgi:drug/metabolite transporter (DMT)-like permease
MSSALQPLALIAAILSTLLSSAAWITQGEATKLLTPRVVIFFTPILTALIIGGYLTTTKQLPSLALIKTHAKDLVKLVITRNVLTLIIVTYALVYTSSTKVMFLTKMEPYIVVFWFWILLGQTISRYHLFLLLVHILGAMLLSTGGVFDLNIEQRGDLLLLFGMFITALSYIPAKRLSTAFSSAQLTFTCNAASLIILIPLFISSVLALAPATPTTGWIYLGITVLLYNVISMVFWYYALTHLQAWLVSALRCLGPVIAAPIAILFFNQSLSGIQIIGGIVVLTTSLMMVISKHRDRPPKSAPA